MILVKVHYGLGNQLFQYALARSLSLRKKVDFRLDTGFFATQTSTDHPRVYQLNQFNIAEQIATKDEVADYIRPSFLERRRRSLVNHFLAYHKREIVNEARLDFDENIFDVKDDAYLFGFWQDLRYFSGIEDILKKELTFKSPPSDINKEIAGRIGATNSISLHIRRGDYLTDRNAINNVGICDLHYYKRGIAAMTRSIPDPVFYIFSDDPKWAKRYFSIPFPVEFIDNNPQEKAFEELRLMSTCKHHIIANSSFSWWGAWLSGNEDKMVITPTVWRRKGPDMFLPPGWQAM